MVNALNCEASILRSILIQAMHTLRVFITVLFHPTPTSPHTCLKLVEVKELMKSAIDSSVFQAAVKHILTFNELPEYILSYAFEFQGSSFLVCFISRYGYRDYKHYASK